MTPSPVFYKKCLHIVLSIFFGLCSCIVPTLFLHCKVNNLLEVNFITSNETAKQHKSFLTKLIETNLSRSFCRYLIYIHSYMNKYSFHGHSHIYVGNHERSYCIHHGLKNEKYDISLMLLQFIAM